MATVEELVDSYVVAVNNKYGVPNITETERHALASKYNEIQADIKRKTGLPVIGMSVANHNELQNLNNRSQVILNFIRESLAFGGTVPESVARQYIQQVKTNDAS